MLALKDGTISKRTKKCLNGKYFVKISCQYRYVKRIPMARKKCCKKIRKEC